jgi:hydrogenase maturation factor
MAVGIAIGKMVMYIHLKFKQQIMNRIKEANKMIQGYYLGYITEEECSEMIDLICEFYN